MSSASSSTASLASTTTVSSRAPLTTRAAQPKDFEAAFASLQSTYGFAAAAPSPVQKTAASRSAATVAPRQASAPGQPKDFEAAFASLQSTYGFAAAAPSPVQKTAPPSVSRSTATAAPRQASAPGQPKDFEAEFASLQSTYGFAGGAPSPTPKPQKQGGSSLFSKFTRTRASSPKAHAAPSAAAYKPKVHQIPRPTPHMIAL